jgi:hypothetical protein
MMRTHISSRIPRMKVVSAMLVSIGLAIQLQAENSPVKIAVIAETQTIRSGEMAKFECTLFDKDNKEVKAPKNLPGQMIIKPPSGRLVQTEFSVKAGDNSAAVSLALREAGVSEITLKCAGLMSRGTMVMVKPNVVVAAPPPRPSADVARRVEAPVAKPAQPLGLTRFPPARFTMTPITSPGTGPSKPLGLILKTRNEPHLADGIDAVSIMVFLDENTDVAKEDIKIELFNQAGNLAPQSLIIKKDSSGAEAQLTSVQAGDVVVEFRKSTPTAILQGSRTVTNRFEPPISTLHVRPDSTSISLLEKCNLIVECLDRNQKQVASDVDRQVTLSIDGDKGMIGTNLVIIHAGSAEAQTAFLPSQWGSVVIHASTPNLFESIGNIKVTLPSLLLVLSIIGGFIGGGISAISGKSKGGFVWQRAGIGLVTGLVFYWACIFLNSYIKVPTSVALNPLSGLAMSIIGGFAGIKVFSMVLKRI